jgi:hypothetical protein
MVSKDNDVDSLPPPHIMTKWQTVPLGIGLLLLATLTICLLVTVWPERMVNEKHERVWAGTLTIFKGTYSLSIEARLMCVVIGAGALGAFVHCATSFATFVGNRTLVRTWIWWYIMRFPIGIALALLVYFVVRGGLLSAQGTAEELSPFGVAALAGLSGMFSKQASDKLCEVFENICRTGPGIGDNQRVDKVLRRSTMEQSPRQRGTSVNEPSETSTSGSVPAEETSQATNETPNST